MSWARLLTKPPGAVLNGERRPEGRKAGRAFVNECSKSIWNTRLADRDAMVSVASGWHTHVGLLIDILNGHELSGFLVDGRAVEG